MAVGSLGALTQELPVPLGQGRAMARCVRKRTGTADGWKFVFYGTTFFKRTMPTILQFQFHKLTILHYIAPRKQLCPRFVRLIQAVGHNLILDKEMIQYLLHIERSLIERR